MPQKPHIFVYSEISHLIRSSGKILKLTKVSAGQKVLKINLKFFNLQFTICLKNDFFKFKVFS